MMTRNTVLLLALLFCSMAHLSAEVRLPKIIQSGMILQREAEIELWGWAEPGERIRVEFNGEKEKTRAGDDGRWKLTLPAMPAGGPYTMTVKGDNEIELEDILIGDVWFCSGQSNMVHQMSRHDVTYAEDIRTANYPEIRQFWLSSRNNIEGPEADLPEGEWVGAVGEAVRPFSAVAYFFAIQLHEKYGVPIGIVNSSIGGTPIEAWTSEEGLEDFPDLQETIAQNKDTAYVNALDREAAAARANAAPMVEDKGLTGPQPWYSPDYTPRNWRQMNIPGYWEDQGIRDLNGTVWFRRTVEVPASMAGQKARLFMGRIVDADEVYVNGQKVGSTGYQYPQREYYVPADLLRAGPNVLAVKVTNFFGKGGFVPDKPYRLFTETDTVDLKGYWQYKVGQVFVPGPPPARGLNRQNQPAALYNAMVAPVENYTYKGALWYQGESNSGRPDHYAALLQALIRDWRDKFDDDDLPVIVAQLPNFMEVNYLPEESNWAEMRQAQLEALELPHTAVTVNIDLGEWNDIHPDNKKDVGERMALAARSLVYEEDDLVWSGPLYKSYEREGNKMILSFDYVGSGLVAKDGGELSQFAIAGEDKKFVWADARIEGDKVVVWSDAVENPRYVRYAWSDNPDNPNLWNKDGLPASPFTTEKND